MFDLLKPLPFQHLSQEWAKLEEFEKWCFSWCHFLYNPKYYILKETYRLSQKNKLCGSPLGIHYVWQGRGLSHARCWGVRSWPSQVPRQLALKVMSTWRSRFSIGCVVSACEKCSQWAQVSQNYSDSWSSMVTSVSVKHQVFRVCHPAAAMCNNLIHWQTLHLYWALQKDHQRKEMNKETQRRRQKTFNCPILVLPSPGRLGLGDGTSSRNDGGQCSLKRLRENLPVASGVTTDATTWGHLFKHEVP